MGKVLPGGWLPGLLHPCVLVPTCLPAGQPFDFPPATHLSLPPEGEDTCVPSDLSNLTQFLPEPWPCLQASEGVLQGWAGQGPEEKEEGSVAPGLSPACTT